MTWVLCLTAFASPIDLHAAVREALVEGPSFAVADAEQRAALGHARTTGTWLENPEARVEQNVDELRAEMSLPIPIAGQPFARAAAGEALHDAALERGDLERAQAALSVARLYLDAERADQLARLALG